MKQITILDSIHCKASKDLIFDIAPLLEYPKQFWRQGQHRKIQTKYSGYMIDKKTGEFLSGLLPKITGNLKNRNIEFSIEGEFETIKNKIKPDIYFDKLKEKGVRKNQ